MTVRAPSTCVAARRPSHRPGKRRSTYAEAARSTSRPLADLLSGLPFFGVLLDMIAADGNVLTTQCHRDESPSHARGNQTGGMHGAVVGESPPPPRALCRR